MPPSRSRIARGRRSQVVLAEWFRRWWPHVDPVYGAGAGRDLRGMPGLAPEVKATADGGLPAYLRQAVANAGEDLPLVIWRPNGYGEERVDEWIVALRLEDATRLLLAAGYGTPEAGEGAA
jgi:hypothetical protein